VRSRELITSFECERPAVAGLSHNVREHTEPADLVAGAQVLMNLVLELAEEG